MSSNNAGYDEYLATLKASTAAGGINFTAIKPEPTPPESPLPAASDVRKTVPLASGCLDYFPSALAAVAELSYWGNEKHNPGEPMHDARGKSTDDADCLLRHLVDRGKEDTLNIGGKQVKVRHSTCVAWRALRLLQREIEEDGAPIAPAARS